METEAGRILFLWLNDLLQMDIFHGVGGQWMLAFQSHRGAFSGTVMLTPVCLWGAEWRDTLCLLTLQFIRGLWGSDIFHGVALSYPLAKTPVILSYLLKS